MVVQVVVIVESDAILDEQIGLRAIGLIDFHVGLWQHLKLNRALNLEFTF